MIISVFNDLYFYRLNVTREPGIPGRLVQVMKRRLANNLEMIKIKYSIKRLKSKLKTGLIFMSFGIILVLISFVTAGFINILLIIIGITQISNGVLLFIIYCFESKKQYLTLKNGELIKNTLIPKRIMLTEIISIREFAGDLKLITDKGELLIDTQIITSNSLAELKNELKGYNIKWN